MQHLLTGLSLRYQSQLEYQAMKKNHFALDLQELTARGLSAQPVGGIYQLLSAMVNPSFSGVEFGATLVTSLKARYCSDGYLRFASGLRRHRMLGLRDSERHLIDVSVSMRLRHFVELRQTSAHCLPQRSH
jgi:hypothetical protein